jgi:hypothetical protein
VAGELGAATVRLRASLIEKDFEIGSLTPLRDQCVTFCLTLNEILDLPLGDVEVEMTSTVSLVMDTLMELKGYLTTLSDVAAQLAADPGVTDRVELQMSWFRCSREAIDVSRSSARFLDALAKSIDLEEPGAEGSADADTGS